MAKIMLPLLVLSGLYFEVITEVCSNQCSCTKLSIKCEGQGLIELPFETHPSVTTLHLSHNNFTNEVLGTIKLFKNVTVLDLSYNNMKMLKTNSLPSRIQELYLDNNKIANLEDDPFGGSENSLKRLSLRSNHITSTISKIIFFYHIKLEYLDLSNNRISSITDSTVFPSSLKELNLSNNPIRRIYLSNFKTTQLVSLDIRNTNMAMLKNKYFKKCTNLRKLRLGGRYLTWIEINVFAKLQQMTYLEISNSNIKFLPTQILRNSPNLKVLNISGNAIDYLEDNLLADSKMSTLLLERNRGSMKLDGETLAQFRNIEHVSLSGNNLTAFPPHLSKNLPFLTTLNLSSNNITTLQPEDVFKTLQVLNVSHNNIGNVTDDFVSQFPALLTLDLSHNNVTTLEGDWSNSSLEVISYSNPWSCDCALKNVILNTNVTFPCVASATHQRGVQNVGNKILNCFICASPSRFRRKQYKDISSVLQCGYSEHDNFTTTLIASIVVAISMLLISVAFVFILRRRKAAIISKSKRNSTLETDTKSGGTISPHRQAPQTNAGYEDVSNTTESVNIYCSVRGKDETTEEPHYQTLKLHKDNEFASENAYIEMNSGNVSNPYNNLPLPPPPPNSNLPSTTYEIAIKPRQASYMDFCDSLAPTKHDHENETPSTSLTRSRQQPINVYEFD